MANRRNVLATGMVPANALDPLESALPDRSLDLGYLRLLAGLTGETFMLDAPWFRRLTSWHQSGLNGQSVGSSASTEYATANAGASSGSGWTASAGTIAQAVDADDAAYAESPAINTSPTPVASLVLSDFGFAVPSGATVTNIEVLDFVDAFHDPDTVLNPTEERTVSLTLDGGTTTASGSSVSLATATGKAEQGPLNVTPDTMPTASEVNNANFGVVIEPTALEQSPLLDNVRHRVYHVTVKVYYTDSNSLEVGRSICLPCASTANQGFQLQSSMDGGLTPKALFTPLDNGQALHLRTRVEPSHNDVAYFAGFSEAGKPVLDGESGVRADIQHIGFYKAGGSDALQFVQSNGTASKSASVKVIGSGAASVGFRISPDGASVDIAVDQLPDVLLDLSLPTDDLSVTVAATQTGSTERELCLIRMFAAQELGEW